MDGRAAAEFTDKKRSAPAVRPLPSLTIEYRTPLPLVKVPPREPASLEDPELLEHSRQALKA